MTNGEKIKKIFPNMNFGTLAQDDVIVNKDYSNNDEPQVFIPKRVWNAEYKAISKVIEQEPCEDCVSRQAVEEMIKAEMPERGMWEIEGDKEKETVCEVCVDLIQKLSALPPVTPQSKTGRWILADEQNKEDVENDNYRFIYSECQCSDIHAKGTIVPYCWKCGARMIKSQESEG